MSLTLWEMSLYTCCRGNHTPVLHPSQIGINPGLLSAYKGHHYPSPGNHFCRFASSCCRSCLLLVNAHACLLCREMSVSVRVHRGAAELLTWPESPRDLRHRLHQHGGENHAWQQGPVQVGVDAGGQCPGLSVTTVLHEDDFVLLCQ